MTAPRAKVSEDPLCWTCNQPVQERDAAATFGYWRGQHRDAYCCLRQALSALAAAREEAGRLRDVLRRVEKRSLRVRDRPRSKRNGATMTTARKSLHDCPHCVCDLDEYTWSDRVAWVHPDDLDELAQMVVNCALDHHYDRGGGVPWGFAKDMSEQLAVVVDRHLGAVRKDWIGHTVSMEPAARAAFLKEVRETLEKRP